MPQTQRDFVGVERLGLWMEGSAFVPCSLDHTPVDGADVAPIVAAAAANGCAP